MAALVFDLQSHSTRSDGALEPAAVVAAAAGAGVGLLALTDHDTVAGVDEALAAGRRHGVRVVPAIELSALDPVHGDLHVCGYRIDHRDPGLLAALGVFIADRTARARRMAAALRAAGLELDEQPPATRRGPGRSVGRPHLAAAVLAHPANARRLAAEGLGDVGAVIEAYLVPGAPGFVPRTTPTVGEAIEVIHAAGGLAVWAHPFWDLDRSQDVEATTARLAKLGLDGVEAFYVTHTREQTRLAVAAARAHGLLTTGSSDFHGPEHPLFSRFAAFQRFGLAPELGAIAR